MDGCYESLRDKRAYQDPQGTITHPSGEHIVAEIGSEMAKNGNMVSDSHFSLFELNRSHLGRMPS
jgi:hypothetical protein